MSKKKAVKKSVKKKPAPKKSRGKSCNKKLCPPPVPEVVNFKVDVPNDSSILNRLRSIRDKVFASFGLGQNFSND